MTSASYNFLHITSFRPSCLNLLRLCSLITLFLVESLFAAESVVCEVEHNGVVVKYSAKLSATPYQAEPIVLDDNFRFKAEAVGSGGKISYVNIYVSDYRRQVLQLIHQAKYLNPGKVFSNVPEGQPFTGRHYVYSPLLGRELIYQCRLQMDSEHD